MNATRRARRRPGENRTRLLAAGLKEFGAHGYHGASTGAIAERAEVPQPHLYANFKTKHELFSACVSGAFDRFSSFPSGDAQLHALVHEPTLADPELQDEARLVLQAVAVMRDPVIGEAITAELISFRQQVGEQRFLEILALAARPL